MPDWLLRLVQMAIVIAVSGTAAHQKWTDSNVLIGAWGVIAAVAFTMAYGKIADWFIERRTARLRLPEGDER